MQEQQLKVNVFFPFVPGRVDMFDHLHDSSKSNFNPNKNHSRSISLTGTTSVTFPVERLVQSLNYCLSEGDEQMKII